MMFATGHHITVSITLRRGMQGNGHDGEDWYSYETGNGFEGGSESTVPLYRVPVWVADSTAF